MFNRGLQYFEMILLRENIDMEKNQFINSKSVKKSKKSSNEKKDYSNNEVKRE